MYMQLIMYSTGPFVHKWYNYTLYRVRSVP